MTPHPKTHYLVYNGVYYSEHAEYSNAVDRAVELSREVGGGVVIYQAIAEVTTQPTGFTVTPFLE